MDFRYFSIIFAGPIWFKHIAFVWRRNATVLQLFYDSFARAGLIWIITALLGGGAQLDAGAKPTCLASKRGG